MDLDILTHGHIVEILSLCFLTVLFLTVLLKFVFFTFRSWFMLFVLVISLFPYANSLDVF